MSYVGGDQRHDKLKSHHPDLGALQAATPGCHEPVEHPRPISAMPQSIRKTLAALLVVCWVQSESSEPVAGGAS